MNTSERITNELIREQASIWYINDVFGAKIMVKINGSVIKSLYKGVKFEFLFGRDNNIMPAIFHKGFRVHDDPIHYISLTGTDRFADEHTSLLAIMNRTYTYIHFHDELNVCVATAKLCFSLADQIKIINLLGSLSNLYVGDFDEDTAQSLNCFDYSLGIENNLKIVYKIDTEVITGTISEWHVMNNTFVGVSHVQKDISIDAKDEGGILEQQVHAVLDSLFLKKVFRNPQFYTKSKLREFTDIFAHYHNGVFLIETKALGIIESSEDKGMDRKVSGLQKQISKGINQLKGAVKKIHGDIPIYDRNKIKIEFKKVNLPHSIVLVSELFPFGNWKGIELAMFEAMSETKMYLNVMDLREFMKYIGNARGDKDLLNLMLIERVEKFVEQQNIHMRLNVIKKTDKD